MTQMPASPSAQSASSAAKKRPRRPTTEQEFRDCGNLARKIPEIPVIPVSPGGRLDQQRPQLDRRRGRPLAGVALAEERRRLAWLDLVLRRPGRDLREVRRLLEEDAERVPSATRLRQQLSGRLA